MATSRFPGSVLVRARTVISAEDLYALADTPVVVSLTPSAGQIAIPVYLTYQYVFGTRPFYSVPPDSQVYLADTETRGSFGRFDQLLASALRAGPPADSSSDDFDQLQPGAPLRLTAEANFDAGVASTITTTDGGEGYLVGQRLVATDDNNDTVIQVTSVDMDGAITGQTVIEAVNPIAVGQPVLDDTLNSRPIGAATILAAGTGFQVGDEVFIEANSAATRPIESVVASTKTIRIQGERDELVYAYPGAPIRLTSDNNTGVYTIVSSVRTTDGESLDIVVAETVVDAGANGNLSFGATADITQVGGGGEVEDFTLTNRGSGFVPDQANVGPITGAGEDMTVTVESLVGSGWEGEVATITQGDGELVLDLLYQLVNAEA